MIDFAPAYGVVAMVAIADAAGFVVTGSVFVAVAGDAVEGAFGFEIAFLELTKIMARWAFLMPT